MVEPGPFPLCARCQKVNGGLVSARHRQVHIRAAGREACVDQGLAGIVGALWAVCETCGCCEDDQGRAYVVPAVNTADAAEDALTGLGLTVERDAEGVLRFALPPVGPSPVVPPVPLDDDFVVAVESARLAVVAVSERLVADTAGIDHPRIAEARDRLDVAAGLLSDALQHRVGVIRGRWGTLRPVGVVVQLGLLSAFAWVAAWVAGLVSGGSGAWTIVGGVVGVVAAVWPILFLSAEVDERIGRIRVGRRLHRSGFALADRVDAADLLRPVDRRLVDVRASVDAAAAGVAVLAGRHVRGGPSPRELVWWLERDAVLRTLARADLSLRQASDALRIWLAAPRG